MCLLHSLHSRGLPVPKCLTSELGPTATQRPASGLGLASALHTGPGTGCSCSLRGLTAARAVYTGWAKVGVQLFVWKRIQQSIDNNTRINSVFTHAAL